MVKCNGVFPTGRIVDGKFVFKIICGRCGSECYRHQPTSNPDIFYAVCSKCETKNDIEKSQFEKADRHDANYRLFRRGRLGIP